MSEPANTPLTEEDSCYLISNRLIPNPVTNPSIEDGNDFFEARMIPTFQHPCCNLQPFLLLLAQTISPVTHLLPMT